MVRPSALAALSLGDGIARAAADLVGTSNRASAIESGSITADDRDTG